MNDISTNTAGILSGIYHLLTTSFPQEKKYSLEYLKWLYCDNPHGTAISSNLVVDEDVKATYAVLPMEYFSEGRPLKAALSLNTATHPDERGRGWFTKLAKMTYESAQAEDVKIILGVANDNSIKGFLKHLDFDLIGQISLRLATPRQHYQNMTRQLFNANRSDAYWKWRLSNPSIEYSKISKGFGSLLVATRKFPIVIGKLDTELTALQTNPIAQFTPLVPAFVYSTANYGIDVPRGLLPSPWHFIIKNIGLSDAEFSSVKKSIWFHGLDSDTF